MGDKVVGGLPFAPEPDNSTSNPSSGEIWKKKVSGGKKEEKIERYVKQTLMHLYKEILKK